jgi:hypothetical protein
VDKVPRYQNLQENDLLTIVNDQLMLGAEKKGKKGMMAILNPDYKSEAYDSEAEYDEVDGYRSGQENEAAGFRIRKDEEYERD